MPLYAESLLAEWIDALSRLVETPSLLGVVAVALLAVPMLMAGRVLGRAGYSPWWVLLVLVPVVNLIALWVFAFVRWPAIDRHPDAR
ncbi:MAG TPA: hypothetical protein VEA81_14830 [Burkholderiaceae bacterium]|nr:hypothetical protein [Burkholderiaceae bacterium]